MATENDVVTGEVTGDSGLYLRIRDEKFECRRVSISWQMMQFARAQRAAQVDIPRNLDRNSERYKELSEKRNNAGMRLMSLMLDSIMVLLKPHERERFEEYMDKISSDGLEPNELESAIGDVIGQVGGERGKEEPTTSVPSSISSTTTSTNVADDLSNKATAEVVTPVPS